MSAVSAAASYMRGLLARASRSTEKDLVKRTLKFIDPIGFVRSLSSRFFSFISGAQNEDEARILGQLGAIQVHHGSAGSNMVVRYFATLHTRSISDLFTASQMALDCAGVFARSRHDRFLVPVNSSAHRRQTRRRDTRPRLSRKLPTFGTC